MGSSMSHKHNPYDDVSLMEDTIMVIRSNVSPYPFPYVRGYVSTLGGMQRPTVLLTVSLQPQLQWKHGILENSPYAKIAIDYKGGVEVVSSSIQPRLRKIKVVSAIQLTQKLYAWGQSILST